MKKSLLLSLSALAVTTTLLSSPVKAQVQPQGSSPVAGTTQLTQPATTPTAPAPTATSILQVLQNPSQLWNSLLGTSSNWLDSALSSALSGAGFGLNALNGFASDINSMVTKATNFTALNPTNESTKLVQALAKAKGIPGSQALSEARNAINTTVISDQGKNVRDSIVQIGPLAQQSDAIYQTNSSQVYGSTLEGIEAMNRQQSAMGSVLDTVMAQNSGLASQIQASNELTLQASNKTLADEKEKNRSLQLSRSVYNNTVDGTTPSIPGSSDVTSTSVSPAVASSSSVFGK